MKAKSNLIVQTTKSFTIWSMSMACLTVPALAQRQGVAVLAPTAQVKAAPPPLRPKGRKAVSSPEFLTASPNKCVHIEIAQDYGTAYDVRLPFHHDVVELLKHAGWFESPPTEPCDATLSISATGTAWCVNYTRAGVKCTGASISGTLRFVTESSIVRFNKDFVGKLPAPSLTLFTGDKPQGPNEAPFTEAYERFFLPTLLDAFIETFGPTPAVYTFCEETYRLPKGWNQWKEEDTGLISASQLAVLRSGKPALNALRQVAKELKWVNENNWIDKPNGYEAWKVSWEVRSLTKAIESGRTTLDFEVPHR